MSETAIPGLKYQLAKSEDSPHPASEKVTQRGRMAYVR